MSHHSKNNSGFTLLELLAVIAIIAVASLFGAPAFDDWNAKKSFVRSFNDLHSYLSQARVLSLTKNTTSKMMISRSGNDYTVSIYHNNSAVTDCSITSGWNLEESDKVISLNSNFSMQYINSICFFKDGTSTGGVYSIRPVNDGSEYLGSGEISVFITTGFIDVIKQ